MNNNTTNLYNQFNSASNKGIIWNLLLENNSFSNIPDNKYNVIKETFDKKVGIMAEQIDESNDRLINLNKKIISDMVIYLSDIKQKYNSNSVPELYNANDLSQQRQKRLNDELTSKKNEFENLTKVNIPETPDFSDKLDTPIGSEMEKMIAEQIALREQQLSNVLNRQDTEEAKKWIDNNNDSIIKLKIGDDINVDLDKNNISNSISPKKQVSFLDDLVSDTISNNNNNNIQQSVDPNNFMALLKKKGPSAAGPSAAGPSAAGPSAAGPSAAGPSAEDTIRPMIGNNNSISNDDNNGIQQMLREILDKQNQILTLLQK